MRKSLSWSKSRLFGINKIVVLYCKCSFWARTLLCFVWLWKELEAKLLTPGQLLGCHWKLLATGGIQSKKNEKHDFLQLGFLSPGQIMIDQWFSTRFTVLCSKRGSKDTLWKKVCRDCTIFWNIAVFLWPSQILFSSIEFGCNYDDLASYLLPWFPIFTKPWSCAVERCYQLLV